MKEKEQTVWSGEHLLTVLLAHIVLFLPNSLGSKNAFTLWKKYECKMWLLNSFTKLDGQSSGAFTGGKCIYIYKFFLSVRACVFYCICLLLKIYMCKCISTLCDNTGDNRRLTWLMLAFVFNASPGIFAFEIKHLTRKNGKCDEIENRQLHYVLCGVVFLNWSTLLATLQSKQSEKRVESSSIQAWINIGIWHRRHLTILPSSNKVNWMAYIESSSVSMKTPQLIVN